MRLIRYIALFALLAPLGCAESRHDLTVDVVTDLMAGRDVTEIRTVLRHGDVEVDAHTISVTPGENLLDGIRAAEFMDVPDGDYVVEVVARNLESSVAKRSLIGLQSDLTITIVLSRACVGLTCPMAGGDPEATECVDGLCVVPDCVGSCVSEDASVEDTAPPVDAPSTFPCPGVVDVFCCIGVGASTAYARAHFSNPDTIVVVRSDGPTEGGGLSSAAITGVGLAAHRNAPLFVTPSTRIHSNLVTYLEEIPSPSIAFVVGGEAAFSAAAATELDAYVGTVNRVGASGMAGTAAAVAMRVGNNDGHAIITNGNDAYLRQSAIAASAAAFAHRPLLYVHAGSSPPPDTITALMDLGITSIDVVGDETIIPPDIVSQLMAGTGVTDVARYSDAVALAEAVVVAQGMAPSATSAGLVSYTDPLLALVAAANRQPILWTADPAVPAETSDYLRSSPIVSVDLMGPFLDRESTHRELCGLLATP
jgi:hypothetical protein